MKVWVDLANSPHPLLFEPIVARLEELGAEVALTFRDHAQTAELTLERWPGAEPIGGTSPAGRRAKAASVANRVRELRRWARSTRPDVALSHNSYAQLLAARSTGVPAVTGMDFEHQPANHVAFRCADRILVPRAMPVEVIARQGARVRKLIRYDGLKEQLYLGRFSPDPDVLATAGIDHDPQASLVIARTAPAGAVYHRSENPLLHAVLEDLGHREQVVCVVLARHGAQAAPIRELGLPNVHVPDRALDARSLLFVADLFLGAGGTMTREAALLGVPTLSLFHGRVAAVDVWLERRGSLRRVESAAEANGLAAKAVAVVGRDRRRADLAQLRADSARLVQIFTDATVAAAR